MRDEDVAQVRAATDLVALVGEHTALRQQGRRWVGLCPFHNEKSPSFSVNAAEGLYYCFGCQASGDAITFVRAMEHLDFPEAVRFLAERAGVALHEDDGDGGAARKARRELYEAMERAVAWYHERLLKAPDAGRARDYLRSRGYDGDVVRQFRLGWAPDDWDALSRHLHLPERVLSGTGLGFVNRRGRMQDSFRARVIFPICDPSGRPVALGGRILPAPAGVPPSEGGATARGPEPKYKNSQETAIYAKRRVLYALNWAKHDVIATGEVVVCEGYTDVIGFFQAGVPRAVATCGTALAEEHFGLLRSFARRIVLAYDADAAGQSATSRVYEWERRHDVDLAVADLPPGSDPAELARESPGALAEAVARARPFLQFRVDRLLSAADLTTAEGRARGAELALEAVAEHPDELVRDQYVMQVADRCRLDPQRLRDRLAEARRRSATRRARGDRPADTGGPEDTDRAGVPGGGARAGAGTPGWREGPAGPGDGPAPGGRWPAGGAAGEGPRPGVEALRLAVHRPGDVAGRLDDVLFVDDLQRRTYRALVRAQSLHDAIERADPPVADLLRRLAVEEPAAATDGLEDPVDSVVAQLVRAATQRALAQVVSEIRSGGGERPDLMTESAQVRRWVEDLGGPRGHDAADRLVAWLRGRAEEGS